MASIVLTDKNLTIIGDQTAKPMYFHIKSNMTISYTGTDTNGTVKLMINNSHPFVFGPWNKSYLGQLTLIGATDVSAQTPAQKAATLAALVKNI